MNEHGNRKRGAGSKGPRISEAARKRWLEGKRNVDVGGVRPDGRIEPADGGKTTGGGGKGRSVRRTDDDSAEFGRSIQPKGGRTDIETGSGGGGGGGTRNDRTSGTGTAKAGGDS